MNQIYINREISWLRFNARVLQEVKDTSVPLLERLRFLGIYSNNLDEFYSVRYAALLRSLQMKSNAYLNIIENQSDADLLEEINREVAMQRAEYDKYYDLIMKELEANNIYFITDKNVPVEFEDFIDDYFHSKLSHRTEVYILDKKLPAPPLRNGAFYLAVKFVKDEKANYALVEVPTHAFSRFVILTKPGEKKQYVMYLEDIIRYHLDEIFKLFNYDSIEAHSLKVTSDAEMDMDNDLDASFLEKINKGLERRGKGEPVRMVYDRGIAKDTLKFIRKKYNFDEYDSINPGGKYHNKSDLMKFPNLGRTDLEYEKIKPIKPESLIRYGSYLEAVSKQDHLLYMPYHDYSVFLRFLREAAIDPKVTKIKITIYRVEPESQVLSALVNAAKNGKEVTAVLELQARFDEANNVKWSKLLEEAGAKVIFGVPGLKVHAKTGYIERKSEDGMAERYSFIGTGNFHTGTSNVYTDYLLLTSRPEITQEIYQLFEFFNANYRPQAYKHLIVSPMQTRKRLMKFIKKEIKNHRKGLPSGINLKLNSLSDKKLIDMLYEASAEGVPIRLVVRGLLCMIPGLQGVSENIEAVSVVDKFLEHCRIYWFKNGGEDRVFIGSADLMERNLDARVEVACPIYDPEIKKIVQDTFELSFNDNVKGRFHDEDSSVAYRINDEPSLRSQFATYNYLFEKNKEPQFIEKE